MLHRATYSYSAIKSSLKHLHRAYASPCAFSCLSCFSQHKITMEKPQDWCYLLTITVMQLRCLAGRAHSEPSMNRAPAIKSNTLKQDSINLLLGFFNIRKNILVEAAGIAMKGRTTNIRIFSMWLEYLHQILYYEGWRTRKAHSASYVMAQSLSGGANNGTIIQADIFFVSNIFCFFVSVCA